MSYKLAVLVVHGMGRQPATFAEPMIEELEDRIRGYGKDGRAICWEPVHWAPVIEQKEVQLWRNLSRDHDLDWEKVRKFIISSFGDALAYQKVPSQSNDVYDRVHEHVRGSIQNLESRIEEGTPLMILAHSLGCVIMSNYIWDRQKDGDASSGSAFEKFETLAGIVTFGCNLPLFTLAYDPVESFRFPDPNLSDNLKQKAKWLNFYDSDDVLGYPLKPLSPSYGAVVNEDIAINVGSGLTSWNMLSHQDYWTDNDFTKPVARFICDFL